MKLKKRHIFTIAACTIAAVFFTCVLVVGLNAEPPADGSTAPRSHSNSKTFDTEEYEIDALDISWLSGPVTVGVSPDGKIHVTERSSRELPEADQMKVTVDSGALKVRWDSQWFRRFINFNLDWFGHKEKELEVLLPRETAAALVEAEVSNTSGPLTVSGCAASEKLKASTVSGKLSVTACSAPELSASSVSGDIELADVTSGESLSANTVSGSLELHGLSAGKLSIDTVSGSCKCSGSAQELTANTVSGEVSASFRTVPGNVDMDSVSGGLTLQLPAGSGFTVSKDSVSGDFRSDFPTEELGGGRYRSGSGGADIRMNTTSGDMEISRIGN